MLPIDFQHRYYCTHWHEVTMQFRRPGWRFLYLSHADTHVLPQRSAGLEETAFSWKKESACFCPRKFFCPYISFIWLRRHLSACGCAQISVFILLMFHKPSSQPCICFFLFSGETLKTLGFTIRFGKIRESQFSHWQCCFTMNNE